MLDLPRLRNDQLAIARHPAKVKVLAMGRRWGKTVMSGRIVMNALIQHGRVAWIAPTYKNTRPLWRWVTNIVAPAVKSGEMQVNKAERVITTRRGGELAIYSGDNIDSIRGEAFNLVVLDEAAKLPEGAWTDAIMPTLADFDGDAILISTPRGRNWFYTEFIRAQQDGELAASWQAPTADNPHPQIRRAAELARDRVPEATYLQEWQAQFVESAGVFRRILDAATAEPQDGAHHSHEYTFGVDWGRQSDYTCIAVIDVTTASLVALDRFNQIDYAVQLGRLTALYERFRPRAIVAESNSMGQPLLETLQRDGLPVVPFTTTNASKQIAIDALALAFERGAIRILPDPVLIGELQSYEAERLPSGMTRYSAPAGMHDDTVMALALAWHNPAPAVAEVTSYVQRNYSTPQRQRPR